MDNLTTVQATYPIKRKKRKKVEALDKKIVFSVYFILACVFSVYCLFPLFWAFYNSLKGVSEYYQSTLALPQKWDFSYYGKIFSTFEVAGVGFWGMAFNSVWLAFASRFLDIIASVLVAYPLARYKFIGKEFFYGIIVLSSVSCGVEYANCGY